MTEALTDEQALAESEAAQRYHALFNAIDQGFCTIDVRFDADDRPVDYRFVEVSPSFERQTGIRDGAGRWMREIAPDQDEHWFEIYGRVARTGHPVRFEQYSTPLGRWWSVYAFRIDDPAIRRIGVLFHDITERKQGEAERERLLHVTERALAEAEAQRERAVRLQALTAALSMSSTPEEVAEAVVEHATGVLDAKGVVIARTSVDGTHLEIMRAGDMPDIARDAWRRFPIDAPGPIAEVARSGEPVFLESRNEWAMRYPAMVPLLEIAGHHANAVTPLVVQGRVLGAMGAAYGEPRTFSEADRALALTVAHQSAQALERARLFEAEHAARADAESANRAKGEFLAVMSHELRTPLNAIGGYAELMEMGIRGPVTEQQMEDLRRIQGSQRHLLGLINEVLNYAKLETGTVHFEIIDVPIREALGAAEGLVAPQARAKGLSLVVTDTAPGLTARADREKLQQILVNLLSNAVKFTDTGLGVASRVELSGTSENGHAVIRVRDSGIGIPANKLEAIFEPFVQVRADLTRPHEGTGLGLAISRDLARRMGGELTVESTAGAGSTFTLTLPAA